MSDRGFVETSHARIAYRSSAGGGLPLLMIHGNSTCREVFRNQLDGRIGAAFKCVAFDLPGHGESSDAVDPDRTYNLQGYAATAVEVMQALAIDRYAVLGWSLGGHIALDMTVLTDSLVGVMITGSPPIHQGRAAIDEGFAGGIETSLAAKRLLSDEEIDLFAHNTCGPKAPYDPFLKTAVARTDGRARALMIAKLACGIGPSQRELAVDAPLPLAIVDGAEDPYIRADYIAALPYKTLWEGKVHELEGVDHAPFWEVPEVFDTYLDRFLKSLA
ncbi:MAG: alpha/beta hydrolase [Rhodospirillales bacterium]